MQHSPNVVPLDEVVMQETHRREAADLNLREAFTNELALEAKARDDAEGGPSTGRSRRGSRNV